MTQKNSLGTNGVNFIKEAKKSLLLSLAPWNTLSVIITLWPLNQHRCLSSPPPAFSFLSCSLKFPSSFFFHQVPDGSLCLPNCTPLAPLYSDPVPGSVDASPSACCNHMESDTGQMAPLQHPAHQHKYRQTWPHHWQERQKSQIGSAVMSVASSLCLADHSLWEESPDIGIKRGIPYASPRDPAADSAVGSTWSPELMHYQS